MFSSVFWRKRCKSFPDREVLVHYIVSSQPSLFCVVNLCCLNVAIGSGLWQGSTGIPFPGKIGKEMLQFPPNSIPNGKISIISFPFPFLIKSIIIFFPFPSDTFNTRYFLPISFPFHSSRNKQWCHRKIQFFHLCFREKSKNFSPYFPIF